MRPVDWEATSISKLRPLPSNGIPVSKWRNRDEALLNIAQGIREAVNALLIDTTLSEQPEEVLVNENPIVLANEDNLPVSTDQGIQSVFFFNTPFIDTNAFYDRRSASNTLLSRIVKRASTSIVGPRRIGKTWLMEYLRHILPAQFGFRVPFAYVDVTSPSCVTVDGFVSLALEEWGYSKLQSLPSTLTMRHLERTVKEMKRQGTIPLLCVDEFEGFTYHEDVFDLQFFANLRSIAGSGLVLIVASKRPPLEIISQEFQSSPFFNILEQVTLKAFDEKEAEAFIQAKSDQAGFTAQECEYFKYYGKIDRQEGWPPVRLQLVGTLLLEAKQLAIQAGYASYQSNDSFYWYNFAKRLEEMYEKVVL